MTATLDRFQNIFFIGVAGTGMSALAQYLSGSGKTVRGSDRQFIPGQPHEVREKLEAAGIGCFPQDGSGLLAGTDLVVVSTAIEPSVPEVQMALDRGIPILKRSEVLAAIATSRKTIAVAGTSGKSSTSALLFDIMEHAGLQPGIISGAGLVRLIKKGSIGNAHVGRGEWLVIEADESDGSIVQYHPEIGLLLNIDKDHQELDELHRLFDLFQEHTRGTFIVNRGHPETVRHSRDAGVDFAAKPGTGAALEAEGFVQEGYVIRFTISGTLFRVPVVGRHNMENILAAVAVAKILGVPLPVCADALTAYEGIYRRHQVLGEKHGVVLIDDYAHNPAKCAASIRACQPLAPKLIAWFQPHGYGPTRFLKHDFIAEIAEALRPEDELWMSEIYYAGGTAVKDISAADLVAGIRANGKQAYFEADRNTWVERVVPAIQEPAVLLLMGARDPGLEAFAQQVWHKL